MIVSKSPGSDSFPRLRLYVAGDAPGARRALFNRNRLLDALGNKLDIEIIDVLARPEEAERAGILATPTLSDESVSPPRRLVGDIGDMSQVFEFFGFSNKGVSP